MSKNSMSIRFISYILSVSILLTSCSSRKGATVLDSSNYFTQRKSIVNSNMYKTGTNLLLSDKEMALDSRIKKMIKTYEEYTDDKTYAPANPFYNFVDENGFSEIAETSLFKLIRKMPKGGNLHLHTTATYSTSSFFNFILNQDNVYVTPNDLTNSDSTQIPEGSVRIFNSTDEIIDGFIPIKAAIDNGYISKDRLISLWTVDEDDEDISHIWDEFNLIFSRVGYIHGIDRNFFKLYYKEAFLEQLRDNVNHIEMRTGSVEFDGDTTGETAIRLLRDVYYELKDEYPDFTLKLILSFSKKRTRDVNTVEQAIDNTIFLKQKIKDEYDPENVTDFIVGIDMVNEEDTSYQLKEYAEYIIKARENGKNFDLYLHAGESIDADSQNIIDAYMLDTKRIGHGLNLYRFPDLMDKVKEKQIALEVCPISNQLLRYCYDLRTHPAVEYLKRDVPIVISSDDPLIFNSKGLSYDFFEAIAGWHLGIAQIKQLCINSIKYSATSDAEKNKMMSTWEKEWDEFIENNYQAQDFDTQKWY